MQKQNKKKKKKTPVWVIGWIVKFPKEAPKFWAL